jgi:hypothetical protein
MANSKVTVTRYVAQQHLTAPYKPGAFVVGRRGGLSENLDSAKLFHRFSDASRKGRYRVFPVTIALDVSGEPMSYEAVLADRKVARLTKALNAALAERQRLSPTEFVITEEKP